MPTDQRARGNRTRQGLSGLPRMALAVVLCLTGLSLPALAEFDATASTSGILIGDEQAQLKVKITYKGPSLAGLRASKPETSFTLSLPECASCDQDRGASGQCFICPKDRSRIIAKGGSETRHWHISTPDQGTTWIFEPQMDREVRLADGATLSFTLQGLLATPPSGSATLMLAARVEGQSPSGFPKSIEVAWSKPAAKIAQFTARPSLVADGTRTTLAWQVSFPDPQSPKNEVTLNGNPPTADECPDDPAKYCVSVEPQDAVTIYTLEAQPGAVKRTVKVHVEQSGWHSRFSPSLDNSQLVPTVLFSDGQILYGIFVEDGYSQQDSDGGTPTFWSISDPVNGQWRQLPSASPPRSMATSSGVFYRDALYLIGGSRAFNGAYSSAVWKFPLTGDPKQNRWTQVPSGLPWPQPRMGQETLVFQDKIWMLGGYDQFSSPLREVWTFDGGNWTKEAPAQWPARGLLGAAVIPEGEISVFGGFNGYQQKPFDDLWTYDGTRWQEQTPLPFENVRALTATRHAINAFDYLNIAYFEKGTGNEPAARDAQTRSIRRLGASWTSDFVSKESADSSWPLESPYFGLQTVSFAGAFWICAIGASDDWPQKVRGNTSMWYFVPPPPKAAAVPGPEDGSNPEEK